MKQKKVLITGGAGFIGSNFARYLLKKGGYNITIFDRLSRKDREEKLTYVQGDITSKENIERLFQQSGPFETVFHLAAYMPDKAVSGDILWNTNVEGTVNLASCAIANKASSFIFTSSNVAYGVPKELPVSEDTPLSPIEVYGKSKAQAEIELAKLKDKINIQIFRCPVVAGIGRLGLQSILFEFISENKNVYVLGDGSNKYQFVDVLDVCDAFEKASYAKGFDIYNIGADEVLTLRQLYEGIIKFAGSSSKIINLPKNPALAALFVLDKLNMSPLGVYQYSMIGRTLYMDTSKIKRKLKWKPKKSNLDTFIDNYKWYIKNKGSFNRMGLSKESSNRSLPKLGAFKLLKLIS